MGHLRDTDQFDWCHDGDANLLAYPESSRQCLSRTAAKQIAMNEVLGNMKAEYDKFYPLIISGVVDSCTGFKFPQDCPEWSLSDDGNHYYRD